MKKQLIALTFIFIVIIASLYLVGQKTNTRPKATLDVQNYDLNQNVSTVASPQDLDASLQDLDNINIDQMDKAINDNAVDSNN